MWQTAWLKPGWKRSRKPLPSNWDAAESSDEFAWILPETADEEARLAVERARAVIKAADGPQPRVTISSGICDSRQTQESTELVRLADRALYFSKEHGRNQVHLYVVGSDELAAASPRR